MRNILLGFLIAILINMGATWCLMEGYLGKTTAYRLYLLTFLTMLFLVWRF